MERKRYEGFSLIEILVVVALIIILATITIVAINPGKNFRDTRNAQRSSDVNAILSAVTQYTTDGNQLPATVTACDPDNWKIGVEIATKTGVENTVSLAFLTEGEDDYIVSIPTDPSISDADKDAGKTGYVICTIGTRVQVAAPTAEDGKEIVVKR
jgi:type IV pilus assembly protein PilA